MTSWRSIVYGSPRPLPIPEPQPIEADGWLDPVPFAIWPRGGRSCGASKQRACLSFAPDCISYPLAPKQLGHTESDPASFRSCGAAHKTDRALDAFLDAGLGAGRVGHSVGHRASEWNPPSAEDLSSASTPPKAAVASHPLAPTRALPAGQDLSSLSTRAPTPPGDVL